MPAANSGPAPDKNQGIGVFRAAHQKGARSLITAEFDGPYINEELVGEASRLSRQSRYRNQIWLRQ